ncbi:hypothetical protein [Saccharopolyspora sp. NPDC002686]|uniref:hypothetical protein n=1 Tax=Saccharopolyspora sp. NPDC002686 TaxID=3154541 RepID=UPI00331AEF7A
MIPLVSKLLEMLDARAADAARAITAALLAAAVVTPTAGRLGDMYGKRWMLLFRIGMLTLGSIVCALSSELAPMLAGA